MCGAKLEVLHVYIHEADFLPRLSEKTCIDSSELLTPTSGEDRLRDETDHAVCQKKCRKSRTR